MAIAKRTRAFRLNKSCNMVLRILKQQDRLATIREIHDMLRHEYLSQAPGLTTVYRAIETLLGLNMLQSVDFGDGEKRYEQILPGEHHHHLICTVCKANVHLDRCFVDTVMSKIENHYNFVVMSHMMELFGTCPDCKQKLASRPR